MAEKTKPRWLDNPTGYKSSDHRPVLGREDAVKMAALAGLSGPDYVDNLLGLLHEMEEALHLQKCIIENEVGLPEQRAALDAMLDAAKLLEKMIREADGSTRQRIFANYPESNDKYDQIQRFRCDVEHLERLRQGLEQAQESVGETRGLHNKAYLKNTAVKLAEIWEAFTGEPFRGSSKRGNDAPVRFVEHGLRKLVPGELDRSVETALNFAAKRMKKKRSEPND